jgi:transposase
MKAMAKHRIHSIEFKRQVAQDFIAGETLHGLAKRHRRGSGDWPVPGHCG